MKISTYGNDEQGPLETKKSNSLTQGGSVTTTLAQIITESDQAEQELIISYSCQASELSTDLNPIRNQKSHENEPSEGEISDLHKDENISYRISTRSGVQKSKKIKKPEKKYTASLEMIGNERKEEINRKPNKPKITLQNAKQIYRCQCGKKCLTYMGIYQHIRNFHFAGSTANIFVDNHEVTETNQIVNNVLFEDKNGTKRKRAIDLTSESDNSLEKFEEISLNDEGTCDIKEQRQTYSQTKSSYRQRPTHEADMKRGIKLKPIKQVQSREIHPQLISMEIYTKLLRQYQDLLTEKIQNDKEYLNNMKILIRQNTKLFKQNQSFRAKFSSLQTNVKIQPNLPQNDHQIQLNPDQEQQIDQFHTIKTQEQTLKQSLPAGICQQKNFKSNLSNNLENENENENEILIGHLSSFGSSKNESEDEFFPENETKKSQSLLSKSKEYGFETTDDTKNHLPKQPVQLSSLQMDYNKFIVKNKSSYLGDDTIFNRRRKRIVNSSEESSEEEVRKNDKKHIKNDSKKLSKFSKKNQYRKNESKNQKKTKNQNKSKSKNKNKNKSIEKKKKKDNIKKISVFEPKFSEEEIDY